RLSRRMRPAGKALKPLGVQRATNKIAPRLANHAVKAKLIGRKKVCHRGRARIIMTSAPVQRRTLTAEISKSMLLKRKRPSMLNHQKTPYSKDSKTNTGSKNAPIDIHDCGLKYA